jgi:hypothetical protein
MASISRIGLNSPRHISDGFRKAKKVEMGHKHLKLENSNHVSFEIQIGYRQIKRKSKCCMSFHPTNNKIIKNSTHH